jgi:LiaF transmembrane domain
MPAPALRVEGFVLGVCLLGLGIAWLLSNLGLLELLPTLHRWWPLCFVIWGLAELYATFVSRRS